MRLPHIAEFYPELIDSAAEEKWLRLSEQIYPER
jgi:hypothetical protein